ncbi:MAG: DUF5610 domain-containing protein [Colwellia sp.]
MTSIGNFINNDSPLKQGGQSTLKPEKASSYHKNEQVNSGSKPSMDDILYQHNSAMVEKLLYQSISYHFSSSNSSFSSVENSSTNNIAVADFEKTQAVEADESLFDFEQVAESVMAFVSSSILAAKERGESDEALTAMFQQAHSGVNKGVDEALDDLNGMNMLSDELSSGIEKSRHLIHDGIDKLHEQLFGQVGDTQNIATIQSASLQNEIQIAQSQTSDLTVITAEGDSVTISFSRMGEQSFSAFSQRSMAENTEGFQFTQSSSQEVNFSFSVEGDLNEQEKSAISSLIKEVNSLQKEFFNGDVEKAFEQALTLNFDPSQIVSFNLDLTQSSSSVVTQKYTEVAKISDENNNQAKQALMHQLKPAENFIKHFDRVNQLAENLLATDNNQITDFYEAILKAGFGESDKLINKWHEMVGKLN